MEKTALIFGSSGLVGSSLLQLLLNAPDYKRVISFVRQVQEVAHPKLEQIVFDFEHLENYSDSLKGDDLFICLGTTIKKAGSKEKFYKVDHDYVVQIGGLASKNGVKRICFISSMGADKTSSVFYSKVKGEAEHDIQQFSFESIHLVRPSLLLGKRKEYRLGERIGIFLSKALSFIFIGPLKKYRPIEDHIVAEAMVRVMQTEDKGCHIYESNELEKIALFNHKN